jgi:hypothetical protein
MFLRELIKIKLANLKFSLKNKNKHKNKNKINNYMGYNFSK